MSEVFRSKFMAQFKKAFEKRKLKFSGKAKRRMLPKAILNTS